MNGCKNSGLCCAELQKDWQMMFICWWSNFKKSKSFSLREFKGHLAEPWDKSLNTDQVQCKKFSLCNKADKRTEHWKDWLFMLLNCSHEQLRSAHIYSSSWSRTTWVQQLSFCLSVSDCKKLVNLLLKPVREKSDKRLFNCRLVRKNHSYISVESLLNVSVSKILPSLL